MDCSRRYPLFWELPPPSVSVLLLRAVDPPHLNSVFVRYISPNLLLNNPSFTTTTTTVSGYLGMKVAVYSNVRTTVSAQKSGWTACFNTAFRSVQIYYQLLEFYVVASHVIYSFFLT